MIVVKVFGEPAPQGSKRPFRNKHTGRIQQVESSEKVVPWREAVVHAAMRAMETMDEFRTIVHRPPLDGPLAASVTFTVKKPKGAPKTKRTFPCKYPDVSKLLRSTEDALTDAGVWADDARVVRYDRLAKVYPDEGYNALHIPGAVIRVWRIGEAS